MRRNLLALVLLLATAAPALAQQGSAVPQQVWFHNVSDRTEKERMKDYGLPKYASATSRLEAELQANANLQDLGAIKGKMDALVASPAAAEKLLGKGYTVIQVSKTPRDVWDRYMDTKDGLLAASNASLRVRGENGVDKINFKPPTAVRFANGVAHRIELGVNVPNTKDGVPSGRIMSFLRKTRYVDNPLREMPGLYPGHDVAEFFNPAVEIKQERAIYEIHHNGAKVGEFSVDKVTARDPANPGKTVEYGRVELEGDHISLAPTAAQQARAASTTWKGPHKAMDTHNEALVESPEVKDVHRMSEILSGHLGVTPAGESKYAQARKMLGLPMPTATVRLGPAAGGKMPVLRQSLRQQSNPQPFRPMRAPQGVRGRGGR